MAKAKGEDNKLYFSTTRSGEPLHFQRKPYAAVFYSMGLLEFSKALKTYNKKYDALQISPDEVLDEAKLYFDLLRSWMENPTLIGGPKAEVGISKLGDVMCVTGLACEFYDIETDESKRSKYLEILKSAGETAKLHYSEEHKVFMENAILGRGLDFSTPGGRLCNPGHSIEVSWFLLHLNKVLLDPVIEKISLSALLGAFEIGWDKECGGG